MSIFVLDKYFDYDILSTDSGADSAGGTRRFDMLDIISFSEETLKTTILEDGEALIAEAEKNPPVHNSTSFGQLVEVIIAWLDQKAGRQDRVLVFLAALPQFAVTAVMNKFKIKVGQKVADKSRELTADRVRPTIEKVLVYSRDTLFGTDKAPDGGMLPVQVGALHNILNCFEVLEKGNYEKIVAAGDNIGRAVKVHFGFVLESYESRISGIESRIKKDVGHPTSSKSTNGKTNGHAASHAQAETPAPVNTMADKMKAALGLEDKLAEKAPAPMETAETQAPSAPPTLVVEANANELDLMAAEMDRLGALSPEALDLAKVGADGGVEIQTVETQALLHEMAAEVTTEEQAVRAEEYLANVPEGDTLAIPVSEQEPELVGAVQ